MSLLVTTFAAFTFASSARADFVKSDVENLKSDLENYAQTGCEKKSYLDSAHAQIKKLSVSSPGTSEAEQLKINRQVRAATAGLQEVFVNLALGDKTGCPGKLREGIKKLNDLPVKDESSKNPTVGPPVSNGGK